MSFANPLGLLALAAIVPIVVLHILRPRRRAVLVPSTFLWSRLERPVSSAAPWQKLRPSWLLFAQLLAVTLLAVTLAQPQRLRPTPLAQHTVFVIDASGSMRATDGAPDRLATAKERATELRGELPDGGLASVVVAGGRAKVLLSASADRDEFDAAINSIEAGTGTPAIADAFTLAQSLDRGDVPTRMVVMSDGGFTPEERALVPSGSRYERVGERSTNRAITRLGVENRGSGLHVRVEIRNTGGPKVRQPVRIDVDGVTAAAGAVAIDSAGLTTFEADVPAGRRIEALLDGNDLLAADNRAVAVLPERRTLRVFLAGDDRFVGQVLAVLPEAEVVRAEGGLPPADTDVAVYNGVTVPPDLTTPLLAIAPPGGIAAASAAPPAGPGSAAAAGGAAVSVAGVVDRPSLTTVRTDDPLLDGLDLSEVAIATTQRLDAPTASVLVGSVETPLLVAGERSGVPYVYLGFALTDSNLPLQLAFPVLVDRVLSSLAGADLASQSLTVGDPLPIDPGAATRLVAPNGTARTHPLGDPAPTADEPGYWLVQSDGAEDRIVAVNVPARESRLEPLLDLPIAPDVAGARAASNGRTAASWLPPFVAALLVALGVEWLLARRANAVGRRQWRWSVGLRAATALCALAALLGPTVSRKADGLATIFVVDDSDSLGPGGRAASAEWVRQALAAKPADDRAAVVVFGGDAQLDQPLGTDPAFGRPEVTVDGAATNVATALRLGLAVAPADARRRVVLVSDGQATRGDTDAALDDAVAMGVPVDAVVVGGVQGPDVAVTGVKAPPLARVGDALTLTATIASNTTGPVEVTLERDGNKVASTVVDAKPGSTAVSLADPAPPPAGLGRYRVRVASATDSVADNDAVSVGVPVDGPARVLIVEGLTGEARAVAEALEAGGIGHTVVSPDAIPTLDVLSTYTGIVLVDVDARTLPPDSVEDMDRAVRDLGRGMVTIGGPRSYGVGGYRNTPLEELLPVVSDVTDPLRRQKVAQVLSIDTSGSMAACHCRPEGNGQLPNGGNRFGGGVNKTDIARAAAVRTASSLSDTDEIGIVAFNENATVILPLQINPGVDAVDEDLGKLKPAGGTFIGSSLGEAAKELRGSDAALKHIIVFSDGFTAVDNLSKVADEARKLYQDEGITVSVIATGEGAAPALEQIAIAGNGRFYLGGDLSQIPQIMAEEAVIASRDFVTEGRFLPEVVSSNQVVRSLRASPELFGYVAATAKPSASTLLRIGDERDPLLASWQVGLGRSTAWTSDATARWSAQWVTWDGFVGFWTQVVKDTFPVSSATGATVAEASDGKLKVSLVASSAFPDQARATARIVGPDGRDQEVELSRADATTFSAEVDVDSQGVYAIGASATDERGATLLTSTALATQAYPPEYRPAPADDAAMARIASVTAGRADPEPAAVWDRAGLAPGRRSFGLRGPLLLAALLLWLAAVTLSRIVPRRAALAGAARAAGRRVPRPPSLEEVAASAARSAPPTAVSPDQSGAPPAADPVEALDASDQPPPLESTLDQLLRRKRGGG